MFNWLLLVSTDGKPDTYGKATNIDYPSVFLGIIIGIMLSALIAFIFLIKHNSKQDNGQDDEESK